MDIQEPTLWDKVGVAAVSLLLAAFLMGVASPVVAGASTSDNAKRDDDFRAITAVEDDEDDDDRDLLRDKSKKSGKKGKKSGKGSGKSRVALADSKGTRDQTGKSTRKDKSDRTGKNTGNGSDTRTGNSRDGTATGAQSKPSKSAPSASRG